MTASHRRGELGETLARTLLEACGYRFLAGRYRIPGGEIDLVMLRGRTVSFIEVKTRQGGVLRPEDVLHPRQLARMRRAARRWLQENPAQGDWLSFDAVTVLLRPEVGEARIRHFMGLG